MRATKALLYFLGILTLVAVVYLGVCWYVRGVRVGPVKGWMRNAKGYGPAKTPEEALERFKKAIDQHDYDAASQYLAGEYREFFEKSVDDAEGLSQEIANLAAAMKKHGVKSDKGHFVLFLLEPFPTGFKYNLAKGEGDSVAGAFSWEDPIAVHVKSGQSFDALRDWRVDGKILHSLLPYVTDPRLPLQVTLKKDAEGHWQIHVPVTAGPSATARHVRDTADYLQKNGSNFENALKGLKYDVKNEPQTKENFENALKTKLEQSR